MDPIQQAVELLRRGEVVGMPTDTVYGLAADPHQPGAIERLFTIKGRDAAKPIGLLVASVEDARAMVALPLYALAWSERHWPGPLTMVARALEPLPLGLGDPARNTVGVRVPDHPIALALLESYGPLAVTSANRAGGEETTNDKAARAILSAEVGFFVPGSCPGTVASTVVDVTDGKARILRQGPLVLEPE
jgi:tRNA threonylcarbamoyl adenosine modification protein (Sua5/YciO/YrdC/YwlC family)